MILVEEILFILKFYCINIHKNCIKIHLSTVLSTYPHCFYKYIYYRKQFEMFYTLKKLVFDTLISLFFDIYLTKIARYDKIKSTILLNIYGGFAL